MKNAMFIGAAIVSAGVGASAFGQVIMDFEDLASPGNFLTFVGSSYSANGFSLFQAFGDTDPFVSAQTDSMDFYQGSTMLANNTLGGTTFLLKDDGEAFSMASIDIATFWVGGVVPGQTASVTFLGQLEGGGSVSATFNGTTNVGAETFDFSGLGFDNITSLSWGQDFNDTHQFDNITIAPVPAPASAAVIGLGGLVAARRRR